ncbi:MAG TPA: pseudouridine synthase [Candidatus Angelobacter sp.]|nr:pseudouridine synthase [Candidatus Angelobacter sp.]
MVRLQKFLADAGVASRRAGEQIILAGRVEVNNEVVRTLGTKIDPARDRVSVDGTSVRPKRRLYVALNKPRGYICSRRDPGKRRAIGDLLPKEWSNLYPVGRLDYDTEGLIFLTNDGEFCLRLTHPRYRVLKKYLATVEGRVEPNVLGRLTRGIVHEGEKLKAEKTRLLNANNSHSVVEVELAEGRYREVRRMFEAQGLAVSHLRRTQIGRIKLGDLPAGRWRTLSETEIKTLLSNSNRADGVPPHEH